MKVNGAALWVLLTETTFVANLVGLVAIGHFLVPSPDFQQGAFGLVGALLLSLIWMRRFEDMGIRHHAESRHHESA